MRSGLIVESKLPVRSVKQFGRRAKSVRLVIAGKVPKNRFVVVVSPEVREGILENNAFLKRRPNFLGEIKMNAKKDLGVEMKREQRPMNIRVFPRNTKKKVRVKMKKKWKDQTRIKLAESSHLGRLERATNLENQRLSQNSRRNPEEGHVKRISKISNKIVRDLFIKIQNDSSTKSTRKKALCDYVELLISIFRLNLFHEF